MDVKRVGMDIKLARVKRGETIESLAKKAGMSVTTISKIERGLVSEPRMLSIQKIADVLEIDTKTLIEE